MQCIFCVEKGRAGERAAHRTHDLCRSADRSGRRRPGDRRQRQPRGGPEGRTRIEQTDDVKIFQSMLFDPSHTMLLRGKSLRCAEIHYDR